MALIIVKPFPFKFCCIISIFLGICAIFVHKKCVVIRKSACPFGQVKTKMYLPESPFFKNSLAKASRLVLMSNPGICNQQVSFNNLTQHNSYPLTTQEVRSVHEFEQLTL